MPIAILKIAQVAERRKIKVLHTYITELNRFHSETVINVSINREIK